MGKNRYVTRDNEGNKLNREFFESYNYRYWLYKMSALDFGIKYAELLSNPLENYDFDESEVEDIRRSLRSEYMFTFYHISEALFTIVYSMKKKEIFWVDMIEFGPNQLNEFVRTELIEEKVTVDEIVDVFYPVIGDQTPENTEVSDKLQEVVDHSAEFIREYLIETGKIFNEKQLLNDYKHGLRLSVFDNIFDVVDVDEIRDDMSPELFEMIRNSDKDVFFRFESEETTLIEAEDDHHKYLNHYHIRRRIDSVDYERYRRLSKVSYRLLEQIFTSIKQLIEAKPQGEMTMDPAQDIEWMFHGFEDEDIDEILDYDFSWSLKLYRDLPDDADTFFYNP